MRRYAATGRQTDVTTGQKTALELVGVTTTRARIFAITFGNSATPADNAGVFQVRRHTAAGTGGNAVVPPLLDPADPAALITAAEDRTAEPTYGAAEPLYDLPLNQRATFHWVAAMEDAEYVMAASATAGIGISGQNGGSVGPLHVTAHWQE